MVERKTPDGRSELQQTKGKARQHSKLCSAHLIFEIHETNSFSCNFVKKLESPNTWKHICWCSKYTQIALLIYCSLKPIFSEACTAQLPCLMCLFLWPHKTPKGGVTYQAQTSVHRWSPEAPFEVHRKKQELPQCYFSLSNVDTKKTLCELHLQKFNN